MALRCAQVARRHLQRLGIRKGIDHEGGGLELVARRHDAQRCAETAINGELIRQPLDVRERGHRVPDEGCRRFAILQVLGHAQGIVAEDGSAILYASEALKVRVLHGSGGGVGARDACADLIGGGHLRLCGQCRQQRGAKGCQ